MTASSSPAPAMRRGRRPGPSTTRQAVLDAARARFAREGFAATTIRGVAEDAGVDASLVMQFFRSKQELFAAVMSLSPHALSRFSAAFDGPAEGCGERVVHAFLDVWEGAPADAEPLMAMLRGAVVHDPARDQLREFLEARLVERLDHRTADPGDAALRAGIVSAMLVGLVLGRRVVGVPTLARADRDELVRIVAPAVQAVLAPGLPVATTGLSGSAAPSRRRSPR